jgi:hypothetical protein
VTSVKSAVYPRFFNAERIGETLKEVSSDLLQIESREIVGRWFHSPEEIDLFLWVDEGRKIVKQQLTFFGQVVEWNIIEGTRTGVVIEEEKTGEAKASETIKFDEEPQSQPLGLAMDLIKHVRALTEDEQKQIITNFFRGQKFNYHGEIEFLKRYSSYNLTRSTWWERFWPKFKRFMRKLFKPV